MAATIGISRIRNGSAAALSGTAIGTLATAALSGSLALAAIFLLARRIAGALRSPLPVLALIGAGLAIATIALGIALIHHRLASSREKSSAAIERWILWTTSLSMPMIAAALLLSGSSPTGLTIMWLTVAGAEVGLWRFPLLRGQRLQLPKHSTAIQDIVPSETESSPVAQENNDSTQQLIYRRDACGKMSVEGWQRIAFAAGQRTAAVHVAFCPAFAQLPAVDAELSGDLGGSVQPTQVLPWGVRFEVKLDSPATEAVSMLLEFVASESEPVSANRPVAAPLN